MIPHILRGLSRPLTVDWSTLGGTATSGSDYTSTSGWAGVWLYPNGSIDIPVPILDDSAAEGDETFTLNITVSDVMNTYTLTADCTIIDNDTSSATLSIGDVDVTEGTDPAAVFVVTLTQPLFRDLTVHYETRSDANGLGIATPGEDYAARTGDITFPAGISGTKTIAITIIDDTKPELPEKFKVIISVDRSYDLEVTVTNSTGVCTIFDNDIASGTWTRKGEWTTAGGIAVAGSDADTLERLADYITGHPEDAQVFGDIGAIWAGREIDVEPLLTKLEDRLRGNVVLAASANKSALFPQEGGPYDMASPLTEAQVNAIFGTASPPLPTYECLQMAKIILARGVILSLKQGEFDNYFGSIGGLDTYTDMRDAAITALKNGDWVYFQNNVHYRDSEIHPDGAYQGANAFRTSPDAYYAWNDGTLSAEGWRQKLLDEYNRGLPAGQQIAITGVPGFVNGTRFVNVPKLAMRVFDSRVVKGP